MSIKVERERIWPIAGLNDALPDCGQGCLYGTCSMPRTTEGCGGCCGCLGGCVVEWEMQQCAPILSDGDDA